MKVLIVEDNISDVQALEIALGAAGCQYDVVSLGEHGIDMCQVNDYDVMILDLKLSDITGYEVLLRLRRKNIKLPIVILSAFSGVDHKVRAFSFGADDHVVKPFQATEFMARLRAIVRRANGMCQSIVNFGFLSIDMDNRQVSINGVAVHFTNKEFQILALLAVTCKDNVVEKITIIQSLYPACDTIPMAKIVDVFICKLRRKILKFIFEIMGIRVSHDYISTVWGRGYKMNKDAHKKDSAILEAMNAGKEGNISPTPAAATTSYEAEDAEMIAEDRKLNKV